MKTSKIPPKETLLPYVNKRKEAANLFHVSEKTIVLWLSKYDLYHPRPNFGCNKLNLEKAREIRRLYKQGKDLKELSDQFKVTIAAISRIIHNITYHEDVISKEVADIVMIYNPDMIPLKSAKQKD